MSQPPAPDTMPKRAMILAAGKGLRMRPLTNNRPKVLVDVAGKALIDHTLDALAAAGVSEVAVNHHHFSDMLRDHLANRPGAPAITLSDESDELLETGGGIAKMLDWFGPGPILAINGDALWRNGAKDTLHRMADAWDPAGMDALLLMVPTDQAIGFDGAGDYFMDQNTRLERRGKAKRAPFMYGGIQMLNPDLFQHRPTGPFSMNVLWDYASQQSRLCGIRHEGAWMHIGTPAGRDLADAYLSEHKR